MESFQSILDQIPIRHDFISHFILFGVVQGFFVALIILTKTTKNIIPVKLIGYFLLSFSLVLLDDYLCYTGLMKFTIELNDSTEPLVLLWAPLIYLFIYGALEKKTLSFRKSWPHFLIPLLYFISQIGYYAHPNSVKLNAYISAYFPKIKHLQTPENLNYYYQLIKDEFRWIVLSIGVFYTILSFRIVLRKSKKGLSRISNKGINKYHFSRNILFIFFGLMLMALAIFLNFENDLGDHYIGIFQTIIVFTISYMILSGSHLFQKSWTADKYESLNATTSTLQITDVIEYVEKEDYHINPNASLNDLSKSLNSNVNHISKLINLNTGKNFNEFINAYRIDLSKKRLIDKNYEHLTIEAIGNSVGFKSKSAFYKAFKQLTGTSPKSFKQNSNLS